MIRITTASPLRSVALNASFMRWLVVLPMAAALIGSVFAVRWSVGSTVAQTAADPDLAQFAIRLSPSDPQTHFTLAKITEMSLTTDDLNAALREYQAAVFLAPNDYRLWLILGSARERTGDIAGAERAFRRAEELAPAYAMPHWAAGNFFLRQGNPAEAWTRLWPAAESMEALRLPVLNLARSYYSDSDAKVLLYDMGSRRGLRRTFLQYLLDQRDPSGAASVWNELDPVERRDAAATGNALVGSLAASHEYSTARTVANDLTDAPPVGLGQLENGGFEGNVETGGDNIFGWRIAAGAQPQIVLDGAQRRSGARSLTLVFEANGLVPLRDVSQLIVVTRSAHYHLSYAVRSADIKGQATVNVEILNAADGRILAKSDPVAAGSSDWHDASIDFTTSDADEGVIVRIGAMTCSAEVCPLFGRIWYDDFELRRENAATSASR